MDVNRDLYILCGGGSKRMGSDKAQLLIHDKTFLQYLTDRTAPVFNSVTLLRGDLPAHEKLRQIPDAISDAGPLAGLLAALRDAGSGSIALLPVDLPLISDDTLCQLNSPIPDRLDALVARSAGRSQPLIGIYHTRIESKLDAFLQSGRRSVFSFMETIACDYFIVTKAEITNINTPEDYRKLR